jgi:hypothetical protein
MVRPASRRSGQLVSHFREIEGRFLIGLMFPPSLLAVAEGVSE